MSYQVLARKWRPHNFSQVVGQQHVLTALINALDQNRLHHAYLFSGTRGVGKTSIARILAKSLNCEQGVTSTPCGVCHHCQAIDEGRFVDLLEIDAASRTKVEDTRELLDNVQYKPAQGRYKVYLIDEVHMLSKSSFNALLKTLEEPPEYVKFLLATTDPQKLPITILSRCLQFHLKSLGSDAIQQQLAYILDQEQHSYEQGALQALAKAAQGSMRDALSLTDQAIAFGNGVVNYQPVLAMLGTLDHHQVIQLLHFVAAGDAANCLQKVAELVSLGPDFALVHNELAATLHQVALAHMLPSTLNGLEDSESIRLLSEQLSPEQVQLFYQIALKGKQDLPLAPEPRIGLEMTLLRMLAFHPVTASAHAAQLATTQHNLQPAAARAAKLDATAPVAPVNPKVQDKVLTAALADNAARNETANLAHSETNGPLTPPDVGQPEKAQSATEQPITNQPATKPATVQPATAHSGSVSHQDVSHALNSDQDVSHALNSDQDAQVVPEKTETAPLIQPEAIAAQDPMPSAGANDPIRQTSTQTQVAPTPVASSQVTGLTGVLEKRNMLRSRKLALESGKAKAKPITSAPIAENSQAQAPAPQGAPTDAVQAPQAKGPEVAPMSLQPSAMSGSSHHSQPSSEVDLPWATDANESQQAGSPMQVVPNEVAPSTPVEQGPPDYGDLPPIEAYGNDYGQYFETPDYSFNHDVGSYVDGDPNGTNVHTPAADLEQAAHAPSRDGEQKPVVETDAGANPQVNAGHQEVASSVTINPPDATPEHALSVAPDATRSSTSALPAITEFEIPSGFSPQNTDPWCQLIDAMALGGILRQLALNSVLLDSNLAKANQLKLLLQPSSAHLDNEKNHQQLLQAVQQVLPQIQEVDIQIGQDANLATPVEIEQQIYLARLAQAKIDIQQDEAVNFFIARFGATVDEASIKPK
ncbi:DNA polymerase III subunit gamma/tau [Motilimonas eburnea]|uniref:DNA polymerase III subunit gamma/tau n=1 Tax=Motilimonas eburnea TaxID=1737488 RepID=UPI001E6347C3|nr:DNA polymerase III subunit gamma/tau [Motilimonas eburnea]MCE2573225.1 DNA polymerase III subunit gamma/tau [Motilimonas eburnea]